MSAFQLPGRRVLISRSPFPSFRFIPCSQTPELLRRAASSSPRPRMVPHRQKRFSRDGEVRKASAGWSGLILMAIFGSYLFQVYQPAPPCRPEYKILQPGEIRLLILSPGEGSDPVTCRLVPAPLANAPRFEALSYVWGNPEPAAEICCDEKTVHVGPNLHSALRNLRHPSRERALWVDALCINQIDAVEKSQQIPLMGDIYEMAWKVLIWLGEPTEETRNALPTLREVNKYLKETIWFHTNSFEGSFARAWLFTIFRGGSSRTLTWQQVDELAAFDWASIVALVRHKWFGRVWIFQEISRAREAVVLVGRDEMPWSSLMSAFSEVELQGIDMQVTSPHMRFEDYLSMMNLLDLRVREREKDTYNFPRRSLAELVFYNRTRDATDDRDRIFAFTGLASDVDKSDRELELAPDYTIPTEEVYRRFALWYLLRKENLQILQYTSPNMESSLAERRLPSWVPDWRTAKTSQSILHPIFQDAKNPYNASPYSKPWVRWQSDQPDVLQIKGRVVDQIDKVAVTEAQLLENGELWRWTDKENDKMAKKLAREDPHNEMVREWRDVHEVIRQYRKGRRDHSLAQRWIEAQNAIREFGGGQEESKLVWTVNCWSIAAMGAKRLNREQLDSWWRTVTLGQPHKLSLESFVEYCTILMESRQGKRQLFPLRVEADYASFKGKTKQESAEWELRRKMDVVLSPFMQRRFCATARRRLGWVPLTTRPGDLICILDGAPVPFVLRPKPEKNPKLQKPERGERSVLKSSSLPFLADGGDKQQYELVGEAYIDGIMHGEALRGSGDGSRIFHLT